MVEVTIDSVRVSLMSQHRIVVLKETDSTRFLPIWIGPFEADAITIELQSVEVARPLTHDLLKATIEQLGAEILEVSITDLRNDTFYAEITLRLERHAASRSTARPSDAIALAVARTGAGLRGRRGDGAGRHHARGRSGRHRRCRPAKARPWSRRRRRPSSDFLEGSGPERAGLEQIAERLRLDSGV